jgi:hypothetical protein
MLFGLSKQNINNNISTNFVMYLLNIILPLQY